MSFDRKTCINNLYFLAKKRGIKVGELETACGASTGYLSRLKQEDSTTVPGIEFLALAAQKLNVSVDALIGFDFSAATPNEEYLHDFIDKVVTRTESEDLVWEEDAYGDVSTFPVNEEGESLHPLFSSFFEGKMLERKYESKFRPTFPDFFPVGMFKCPLSSDKKLYLVEVMHDELPHGGMGEWTELELYIIGPHHSVSPVCHTVNDEKGALDDDLHRLYDMVQESVTHPHVSPDVKSAIDEFMSIFDDPS